MTSSQTPVLAAIGAVVLGVSLAATGGSAQAASSAPVLMAASYTADPADPDPVDAVAGGLVPGVVGNTGVLGDTGVLGNTGILGSTGVEDLTGGVLKAVGLVIDDLDLTKLPEELLKLNPAPQTVDQILSTLLS